MLLSAVLGATAKPCRVIIDANAIPAVARDGSADLGSDAKLVLTAKERNYTDSEQQKQHSRLQEQTKHEFSFTRNVGHGFGLL